MINTSTTNVDNLCIQVRFVCFLIIAVREESSIASKAGGRAAPASSHMANVIVYVSFWKKLHIHALAVVLAVWVSFKRLIRFMWKGDNSLHQVRENPPQCLVDSSYGQHKYVKLKVRF